MNNYFMPLRQTICIYTLSFLSFGKIVQNEPKGKAIYLTKCLWIIQIWPCFIIETNFCVWKGCTSTHFSDIKIMSEEVFKLFRNDRSSLIKFHISQYRSFIINGFEKYLHIQTQ